jgi:hypothetical protein
VTPADGFAAPAFDATADIYTFDISSYTNKATYSLKGYFNGALVIESNGGKKGITFNLDEAYLTNTAQGGVPISYEGISKTVTISSAASTVNYIVGTGNAVYSAYNAEFNGSGKLFLKSLSSSAVCAQSIRVYDTTTLDVTAPVDAFNGASFAFDNGEKTPTYYSGNIAIHDLGGIAFDLTGSSAIVVGSEDAITVDSATSILKANGELDVNGSLIGTNIAGDPLVPLTAGGLKVVVADGATFTSNGAAITSETL